MTKAQAINSFWNRFGIPAYEMNTVPVDAQLPYITYSFVTGSAGEDVSMDASVWYRSTSWTEINAKADEIGAHIGLGGTVLRCDGGAIWIRRGQPFAQSMSDPTDDMIRRKYINITAEYITN